MVRFSKELRDKDAVLFKALAALPVSFVKEGKSQYKALINHGYSCNEIVYLNYVLLNQRPVKETVEKTSLVGEKIAVSVGDKMLKSGG